MAPTTRREARRQARWDGEIVLGIVLLNTQVTREARLLSRAFRHLHDEVVAALDLMAEPELGAQSVGSLLSKLPGLRSLTVHDGADAPHIMSDDWRPVSLALWRGVFKAVLRTPQLTHLELKPTVSDRVRDHHMRAIVRGLPKLLSLKLQDVKHGSVIAPKVFERACEATNLTNLTFLSGGSFTLDLQRLPTSIVRLKVNKFTSNVGALQHLLFLRSLSLQDVSLSSTHIGMLSHTVCELRLDWCKVKGALTDAAKQVMMRLESLSLQACIHVIEGIPCSSASLLPRNSRALKELSIDESARISSTLSSTVMPALRVLNAQLHPRRMNGGIRSVGITGLTGLHELTLRGRSIPPVVLVRTLPQMRSLRALDVELHTHALDQAHSMQYVSVLTALESLALRVTSTRADGLMPMDWLPSLTRLTSLTLQGGRWAGPLSNPSVASLTLLPQETTSRVPMIKDPNGRCVDHAMPRLRCVHSARSHLDDIRRIVRRADVQVRAVCHDCNE